MDKRVAGSVGAAIVSVITPLVFPTIPFEIGIIFYVVALCFGLYATSDYWRPKIAKTKQKFFRSKSRKAIPAATATPVALRSSINTTENKPEPSWQVKLLAHNRKQEQLSEAKASLQKAEEKFREYIAKIAELKAAGVQDFHWPLNDPLKLLRGEVLTCLSKAQIRDKPETLLLEPEPVLVPNTASQMERRQQFDPSKNAAYLEDHRRNLLAINEALSGIKVDNDALEAEIKSLAMEIEKANGTL